MENLSYVLELLRNPRDADDNRKWGRVLSQAALSLSSQIHSELTEIANQPRGLARVHTPALDRLRDPNRDKGRRLSNVAVDMKAQRESTVVQPVPRAVVPQQTLAQPQSAPYVTHMQEGEANARVRVEEHAHPGNPEDRRPSSQMPPSQSAPQLPLSQQASAVGSKSATRFAEPLEDSAIYADGSEERIDATGEAPRHMLSQQSIESGQTSTSSLLGQRLPIVLPGKLQWVRDTHRRLGIPKTTSLGALGIRAMPSEIFFGPYDGGDPRNTKAGQELIKDDPLGVVNVTNRATSRGQRLAPIIGDDGVASSRMERNIRAAEKRKEWNIQSFDRVRFHD